MEYYWTNNNGSSSNVRGHHAWDLPLPLPPPTADEFLQPVMVLHDQDQRRHSSSHLTCLKLGKRQYFEDLSRAAATKKGKGAAAAEAVVPTCQVGGCEAVLVNAKDYHRRHKVCEMHAKAPKVVLLGIEQRFCQQCSRFHELSEFDETKRSCRRRLAGHNERRRKGSHSQEHHHHHHNSINNARKHYQEIKMMMARQPNPNPHPHPHPHPHVVNVNDDSECALSLLSPTNYAPWNSFATSSDLPARCSAALRELIAENRQLIYANNLHMENYKMQCPEHRGGHVTLNLMQKGPGSPFGLLSGHDHSSTEDDGHGDCSDLWKFPFGY